MTTVVQRVGSGVYMKFPMPVYSCREGTAFLEMDVCADGYGIVIRRHSRWLNRFWTVWAQECLLKLDAKYIKTITVEDNSVRMVSEHFCDAWVYTAATLLADIVPFPEPPMSTHDHKGRPVDDGWEVYPSADLSAIIARVNLPKWVRRWYKLEGGRHSVWLRRNGKEREKHPPINVIKRMVELEVARLCARDGVPLDWVEIRDRRRRAERAAMMQQFVERHRAQRRSIITVELPPVPRVRRRTVRGEPVVRDNP